MARLDTEEKELLESYERDEWQSIPADETQKQAFGEYARATLKRDMRVNVRITRKDLEALQTRALEEGVPYQTFIASVLHKYATGRLQERSA